MLPTENYVDRPKTKNAIALAKIILKICTFSMKNMILQEKKQQINLNFELALNISVVMLLPIIMLIGQKLRALSR